MRSVDGFRWHAEVFARPGQTRLLTEEPMRVSDDVVPVAALSEAVMYAGVATQTVGVYPDTRKAELRDALACAGVQRVVSLGGAGGKHRPLPRRLLPAATAHALGERRVSLRNVARGRKFCRRS